MQNKFRTYTNICKFYRLFLQPSGESWKLQLPCLPYNTSNLCIRFQKYIFANTIWQQHLPIIVIHDFIWKIIPHTITLIRIFDIQNPFQIFFNRNVLNIYSIDPVKK